LGAHKTGTTFLQKSLDLSQAALQAGGVQYMELNRFRDKYTRPLLYQGAEPAPNEFDPAGVGTHLVFDENIPALVQLVCHEEGIYPHGVMQARRIADHLQLQRPTLVFGVRSFVDYLPSLYCERLKANPFRAFRGVMNTPLDKLRWYPWLQDLQAGFPGSRLLVYRAENLRGNEQRLLSKVTGLAPESFTLLEGNERPGFSHQAIRTLLEIHKTRKVERKDLREAVKAYPKGAEYPGFQPWHPPEIDALRQNYEQDMAAIKADPNITLLLETDPA